MTSISDELRKFFVKNCDNLIKFWEYPSHYEWSLHKVVDKETKKFCPKPYYPCKSSLDFNKKSECNNILMRWKMTFQASDKKGHQFLELLNDDNKPLEPIYSKGISWLKYFGHSILLCMRATRAIVNHISIGEYQLRFFPQEEFKCPCGTYPIETRHHVLFH